MLVTEKIFGFLLAALGVQLVIDGLSAVGVVLYERGGGFTMRYTCEVTRFARR